MAQVTAPPAGAPVLVVEDDPAIADLLRTYLRAEGFPVVVVTDGQAALDAVRARRPVAVLLDVSLPGGTSGTEVCRRMRHDGDWTPVLLVTARDEEADRVLGLELGADDYVTKPFSPRELVARLRAVLRRAEGGGAAGTGATGTVLRHGRVVVDTGRRTVTVDDQEVMLTATEFDLLAHLLRRPGHVHPREELLARLWGYPVGTASRTVDVHVAQLRAKLGGAVVLRSVRGVGYAAGT